MGPSFHNDIHIQGTAKIYSLHQTPEKYEVNKKKTITICNIEMNQVFDEITDKDFKVVNIKCFNKQYNCPWNKWKIAAKLF